MNILIDQDIAHIGRVMRLSSYSELGDPHLSTHYWRQRLNALLDYDHLTQAQLRAVDGLLLELDELTDDSPY